jgi:hypothetical protein
MIWQSMRQISDVSMVDLAKSTFTPERSGTSGRRISSTTSMRLLDVRERLYFYLMNISRMIPCRSVTMVKPLPFMLGLTLPMGIGTTALCLNITLRWIIR